MNKFIKIVDIHKMKEKLARITQEILECMVNNMTDQNNGSGLGTLTGAFNFRSKESYASMTEKVSIFFWCRCRS